MPTFIAVQCPYCHSDQIVKRGKTARRTQCYLCQNQACATGSFLLDYRNRGYLPEVKELIIDMSLNASGVRDTARSLHISTNTVFSELKKKESVLESVNIALLNTLNPDEVTVDIERAGEAEMDEMWSFVRCKTNPRWLWHAIDHQTGKVLAYVFGRRKDKVFLKLKALLEPFDLTHYYTDKWGAYTRHLDEYEVRTWEGWHHHMALSLMAVWFLIGETHRGQQLTPALTLPQVRSGLSRLLLEVYYTPGVDEIARQVQRQLMRNELARLYHHRTRKCIPPRKLRREIPQIQ